MSDKPSSNLHKSEEIKRLLERSPIVRGACELDVLVFLYRHPRSLLTSEQLTAFVGYEMKRVAKAVDAFLEAGLLERTQNPNHAARLYLLVLNGPHGGGVKTLLEIASTRQGRREILQLLGPGQSQTEVDISRKKMRLHAIA